MTTQDGLGPQALMREIQGLGSGVSAARPGRGAEALARQIFETTRGFERVALLEALLDRTDSASVFARAWSAHYALGEAELRSRGILREAEGNPTLLHVPPHDALALLAAGRMLSRRGREEAALDLFRRAGALRPDDPFAATWQAMSLATLGRHDEADACFETIGRRHPWPCAITRVSPRFWQGLRPMVDTLDGAVARPAPIAMHPAARWLVPPPVAPHPSSAGFVVLVSCDRAYFERYAADYVGAWVAHGGAGGDGCRWRLHLHLVEPDDACRERVAGWQAGGLPIAATAEPMPAIPTVGGGANEPRTLYACARLRALPWALAFYGVPVVVTDIDLALRADPAVLLRSVADADCGLIRYPARVQPLWQEFYLALAVFRPTPRGRRFAAMLAAYVSHFIERQLWVWSLDQTAVYSAVAEATRSLPGWTPAFLSPGLVHSRLSQRPPADEALFHHLIGSTAWTG